MRFWVLLIGSIPDGPGTNPPSSVLRWTTIACYRLSGAASIEIERPLKRKESLKDLLFPAFVEYSSRESHPMQRIIQDPGILDQGPFKKQFL
jgi:hypothetical protein